MAFVVGIERRCHAALMWYKENPADALGLDYWWGGYVYPFPSENVLVKDVNIFVFGYERLWEGLCVCVCVCCFVQI